LSFLSAYPVPNLATHFLGFANAAHVQHGDDRVALLFYAALSSSGAKNIQRIVSIFAWFPEVPRIVCEGRSSFSSMTWLDRFLTDVTGQSAWPNLHARLCRD